jgi:hypothetical protein
MAIKKDDYVEGYEHYGYTVRKTKGWVDNVKTDGEQIYYDIQADDYWKGARGTTLFSELGKVEKLESKLRP